MHCTYLCPSRLACGTVTTDDIEVAKSLIECTCGAERVVYADGEKIGVISPERKDKDVM